MQRIPTLLKKIAELAEKGDSNTTIDIDLMLDYTKVIYADLLEWRARKTFVSSLEVKDTVPDSTPPPVVEKTKQEEIPAIKEQEEEIAEDYIAPPPQAELAKDPVIEFVVNAPELRPEVKPAAADVRQSIGINDKYLFMSELFSNDRDKYEQALDRINSFGSYTEAEVWLNENIGLSQNSEENDTPELFRSVLGIFFKTK